MNFSKLNTKYRGSNKIHVMNLSRSQMRKNMDSDRTLKLQTNDTEARLL